MRLFKTSLAALALLALGVFAPAAHAQFGVAAGVNFDKLSDIDDGDNDFSFDNSTGYHIGLFVDLPLGPVALRPGIFYTDVGTIETDDVSGARESFNVNLVEIPIDVRYRLLTPIARPYVSAGPVFRFANQDDDEFELENFTLAGSVGLGLELNALGFRPFVETRYQFGVSDFVKDDTEIGGVTISPGDARLNTFMLRAGLTF